MRTNNYLWAMLAAATLTLTGCGSDENGIAEPQLQEKTAQLELRLTGSGVNTKATGSALPTQAEENTLKRFTVAIFNSDNSVNAIRTITTNMTSATTINCTPAAGCTGIITRNNTYAIKATIKNIGTTDPMGDITPTSLELTVNVATWALNITQDVTFD